MPLPMPLPMLLPMLWLLQMTLPLLQLAMLPLLTTTATVALVLEKVSVLLQDPPQGRAPVSTLPSWGLRTSRCVSLPSWLHSSLHKATLWTRTLQARPTRFCCSCITCRTTTLQKQPSASHALWMSSAVQQVAITCAWAEAL